MLLDGTELIDVREVNVGDTLVFPTGVTKVAANRRHECDSIVTFDDGFEAKYKCFSRVAVARGRVTLPDFESAKSCFLKTGDMFPGDVILFDAASGDIPKQIALIDHISGGYSRLYFTDGTFANFTQREWVKVYG